MKRVLAVVLALAMIFSICACGTQAPAKAAEAKTLRLAHIFAQDGSANLACQKFAQIVEEKTKGAYKIEIYPNSQLGDERELCEAVTMGTVDMTLCGDSFIGWYCPEYLPLCAFFTWESYDHAKAAYRGSIGESLTAAYSKACGSTVLDYWMRAPRYICTTREIHNLNDMKGLTLRIPDDQLYYESFKALGANPTPLAFDEIYMAVKQGTVEGLENPMEDLYNNSFYDVNKYIINTAHQISMFALIINDKILAGLPADVQKIMKDAAIEAGDYQNELMEGAEADYKAKLEEKGMIFITTDDFDKWRDIINTEVPPKFADVWMPGLLEEALALAK
jgi:tripartite ATP-independent transporter DctP family solute receptor